MEIEFPVEFLVYGTPVSAQAERAESRDEWKQRVRDAISDVLSQPYFLSSDTIAVTLYYFPEGPMQGDVDNIVKLVLDAMNQHIYLDDSQVERIVVHKFEPGSVFNFSNPSETLTRAVGAPKPVLYVRVSNDPLEDLR